MHEAFKYQVLLPTRPDQEEAYENRVLINVGHDCRFFTKPLQAKHFVQLRAIIMGQKWQGIISLREHRSVLDILIFYVKYQVMNLILYWKKTENISC